MRIVIEIDAGEHDAANAIPSAITMTFPQEAVQSATTVVPSTGQDVTSGAQTDDQDGGGAPGSELAPGEPSTFTDSTETMAPGLEVGGMDAGAAPGFNMSQEEPSTLTDEVVSTYPTSDSQAMDAGAVLAEDLSPGEPALFTDIPVVTVTADDDNGTATDAGAAPNVDLASDTDVMFTDNTASNDMATPASGEEFEAMDAGTAPGDAEALDEPAAEESDTGIGALDGQPPIDAGAPPANLFAEPAIDDTPGATDDLTAITGIGPKRAAALIAGGITTLAQIAASSVDELQQVLDTAGIHANVDTWIAQAQAQALS